MNKEWKWQVEFMCKNFSHINLPLFWFAVLSNGIAVDHYNNYRVFFYCKCFNTIYYKIHLNIILFLNINKTQKKHSFDYLFSIFYLFMHRFLH